MNAMAKSTTDVAVIGHFSIDSIILPSTSKPNLIMGGAVAYVSLVTRRLGASALVISKVGGDFPEAYFSQLQEEGVDISNIIKEPGKKTTSFELTYGNDLSHRKLRLRNLGLAITPKDLPPKLHAKAIHIAPIADEISFEVVEHLRDCCDYLSIDPQGMTRRFNKKGDVANSAKMDKRVLSLVDIYKSSFDEIQVLSGKKGLKDAIQVLHDFGPSTVIVTMGAEGSVISNQSTLSRIPVCKPTRVVDPTGAGDVFIGAFVTEYVRKKEPFWCACVGSAAASLVVEGIGTSFFGNREEIYRRAKVAYEKEIKP